MFQYISQQRQIVRSYYSGIGKTAVIYPAAFLVAVGMGQVSLGLIFFARDVFNATPTLIGRLAGVWAISFVFGCLVIRQAFNRVLPRYLIVGSTLCLSALVFGMQHVPTLGWIFVLYVLYGMAASLFWPPLMAWLSTDTEGTALGRVLSRFNVSWCIGNTVSPFICGWLSEQAVHLPLLFGSGLFLLTATFVTGAILVLPKVRYDNNTGTNANTGHTPPEQSTLLRYPAWIGLFASFFGSGVIAAIFPVAAREELSMAKSVIGLLLLVYSLLNTTGFVILGRTAFWHFRSLPMLVGQLVGAAVFVGMAYAKSIYPIGILFAIWGMSIALSYSNGLFHGVSGSLDRARRMAIHESTLALGIVVGSVTGGMVYQLYTIAHVYWLCAIVLFTATLVQSLLCALAHQRDRVQKLRNI